MRKPRVQKRCSLDEYGVCAEVLICYDRMSAQPREWRKAAKWLRQVADWWEWLADKQEAKEGE
jgi:hypothetical protein